MLRFFLTTLLLLGASLVIFNFDSEKQDSISTKNSESLTFSNTQKWDPELIIYLDANDSESSYYLSHITLPPPPSNFSTTTDREIAALHVLAENHTEAEYADIQKELTLNNFKLGTFIVGTSTKPLTKQLIATAHRKITPLIFFEKDYFDRIRPSYLDPTLHTLIEVPSHPSYPSGHAAEAYLIAELLSRLDPNNNHSYFTDAARIARNREIAGVHYPSDSEAGRKLASQFISLFLKTEEGKSLFKNASIEWR